MQSFARNIQQEKNGARVTDNIEEKGFPHPVLKLLQFLLREN